jgi:hypothetical protein
LRTNATGDEKPRRRSAGTGVKACGSKYRTDAFTKLSDRSSRRRSLFVRAAASSCASAKGKRANPQLGNDNALYVGRRRRTSRAVHDARCLARYGGTVAAALPANGGISTADARNLLNVPGKKDAWLVGSNGCLNGALAVLQSRRMIRLSEYPRREFKSAVTLLDGDRSALISN